MTKKEMRKTLLWAFGIAAGTIATMLALDHFGQDQILDSITGALDQFPDYRNAALNGISSFIGLDPFTLSILLVGGMVALYCILPEDKNTPQPT